MKLTNEEIRRASSSKLRSLLKEDIVDFAKKECGVDPCYITELQEIVDLFKKYLKGGES